MAQWNLWRKHFYLWIFFWPRHAQNCLMIIWISDLSAMVNQIFQLTALGYHCQCGHIQNSIVYYVFFLISFIFVFGVYLVFRRAFFLSLLLLRLLILFKCWNACFFFPASDCKFSFQFTLHHCNHHQFYTQNRTSSEYNCFWIFIDHREKKWNTK